MRGVYYNDAEPFVCDWLENLIAAKLLPAGDVDRRPIQKVSPDDVRHYTQAHFFAGVGGWPYALQLAGWGDRPVWTGSCPCQPFSAAGKRGSHADERHLWPAWYDLLRECHPRTIFGEQVSGAAGLGWLDAVALDLEAANYAVGACVLGAHSVGAPHLRQRLYFVADRERSGLEGLSGDGREWSQPGREREDTTRSVAPSGGVGELDNPASPRRNGAGEGPESETRDETRVRGSQRRCGAGELADARCRGNGLGQGFDVGGASQGDEDETRERERVWLDAWAGCEFIPCRDGKARPVEPGTFPLAHGIPGRVGRLRAYGNAIVPQVAAAFVSAYLECVA